MPAPLTLYILNIGHVLYVSDTIKLLKHLSDSTFVSLSLFSFPEINHFVLSPCLRLYQLDSHLVLSDFIK